MVIETKNGAAESSRTAAASVCGGDICTWDALFRSKPDLNTSGIYQ
jgi:hypothetical protein